MSQLNAPSSPEFEGVRAVAVANVYFNGGVVSHTVYLPTGARKTLGVIFPGSYEFTTNVAERLEITAGECEVTLPGAGSSKFKAGTAFDVGAGVTFQIQSSEIAQYVCSYF